MYLTHYVRVTLDRVLYGPDAAAADRAADAGDCAMGRIEAGNGIVKVEPYAAYLADGTAVGLRDWGGTDSLEQVAEGLRGVLASMLDHHGLPDVAAAIGPDSNSVELRYAARQLLARARAQEALAACGTVAAFDPFLHTLADGCLDEDGVSDLTSDAVLPETWLVALSVQI